MARRLDLRLPESNQHKVKDSGMFCMFVIECYLCKTEDALKCDRLNIKYSVSCLHHFDENKYDQLLFGRTLPEKNNGKPNVKYPCKRETKNAIVVNYVSV